MRMRAAFSDVSGSYGRIGSGMTFSYRNEKVSLRLRPGCDRYSFCLEGRLHQSFSRKWEVSNAQAKNICHRVRDGTGGRSKRDFADARRWEFGTRNDFHACFRRLCEGENRVILPELGQEPRAVGRNGFLQNPARSLQHASLDL